MTAIPLSDPRALTHGLPTEMLDKRIGDYLSFVLLMETRTPAMFRTDEQNQRVRVRATPTSRSFLDRLMINPQKVNAAFRSTMRESLLRHYGVISAEQIGTSQKGGGKRVVRDETGKLRCEQNYAPCMHCPACLYLGGVSSGVSKQTDVLTEYAYSLTADDRSVRYRSGNALYDNGTTSADGRISPRLMTEELIDLHTLFPLMIQIANPTPAELALTVLAMHKTSRIGAGTNHQGVMRLHWIAALRSDIPLRDNLFLTQHIYGTLLEQGRLSRHDPIIAEDAIDAAHSAIDALKQDNVAVITADVRNEELARFFADLLPRTVDATKELVWRAAAETAAKGEAMEKARTGDGGGGKEKEKPQPQEGGGPEEVTSEAASALAPGRGRGGRAARGDKATASGNGRGGRGVEGEDLFPTSPDL